MLLLTDAPPKLWYQELSLTLEPARAWKSICHINSYDKSWSYRHKSGTFSLLLSGAGWFTEKYHRNNLSIILWKREIEIYEWRGHVRTVVPAPPPTWSIYSFSYCLSYPILRTQIRRLSSNACCITSIPVILWLWANTELTFRKILLPGSQLRIFWITRLKVSHQNLEHFSCDSKLLLGLAIPTLKAF